ncbi:MAG TPA: zinc finger domain-containing protein, partial [Geminicoccaceae bacterium]
VVGTPPEPAYRLEEVPGVGVVPGRASGQKCARCWRILPEVGAGASSDLCDRCTVAVGAVAA